MNNIVKSLILETHEILSDRLNSGAKKYSSEKSIVFDFAWQFSLKNSNIIKEIDFEPTLFQSFSDGTFLDLLLELNDNGKVLRVGVEFKFPYGKGNGKNTGQTQQRQKIINDIKRLNWLVAKEKIDIGCFICFTNENNYINSGNYSVATEFKTHHGVEYLSNYSLPVNEKSKEEVNCVNDITFEWDNIELKDNKYCIPDGKFAILKPIFIEAE